jgi:hypothetical protein
LKLSSQRRKVLKECKRMKQTYWIYGTPTKWCIMEVSDEERKKQNTYLKIYSSWLGADGSCLQS